MPRSIPPSFPLLHWTCVALNANIHSNNSLVSLKVSGFQSTANTGPLPIPVLDTPLLPESWWSCSSGSVGPALPCAPEAHRWNRVGVDWFKALDLDWMVAEEVSWGLFDQYLIRRQSMPGIEIFIKWTMSSRSSIIQPSRVPLIKLYVLYYI